MYKMPWLLLLQPHHVGLPVEHACNALSSFHGVKRRLEILWSNADITLYDDFAHHPTAIETTLKGIRAQYPDDHIVAVFDPHSNTMKRGEHSDVLANAFIDADQIWAYQHPELEWEITDVFSALMNKTKIFNDVSNTDQAILSSAKSEQHTHFVVLSNGSFSGLRQNLLDKLRL